MILTILEMKAKKLKKIINPLYVNTRKISMKNSSLFQKLVNMWHCFTFWRNANVWLPGGHLDFHVDFCIQNVVTYYFG